MHTYSGRAVFPEDSEHYEAPGHPTLDDIAIGLSRTMRFAGQTPHAYSVLCHSLVVATIITEHSAKVHGLLHDAAEAIVGDVPTPWKPADHATNEVEINTRLYRALELPLPSPDSELAVHEADLAARAAEAHALGHRKAQEVWPREEFSEMAEHAYQMTVDSVAQNLTMQFFQNPQAARQTFITSVQRAMPGQEAASKLHIPTGQVPKP